MNRNNSSSRHDPHKQELGSVVKDQDVIKAMANVRRQRILNLGALERHYDLLARCAAQMPKGCIAEAL